MEDTPRNQSKFNALYWGQPVGRVGGMPFLWKIGEGGRINTGIQYLELKSIELLTNADVREFLELLGDRTGYSDEEISEVRTEYLSEIQLGEFVPDANFVDFMRSKGFAWGWMGVSVEEQVNRGWIKLKVG